MKDSAKVLITVIICITAIFISNTMPPMAQEAKADRSSGDMQPYDGVVLTTNGELRNYAMAGTTPGMTAAIDPYIRFINRITGEIWNSTLGEWGDGTTPWEDSNVEMEDQTTTYGAWKYIVPDDPDFKKSWYDVVCYDRENISDTPAYDDTKPSGASGLGYINSNHLILSFNKP